MISFVYMQAFNFDIVLIQFCSDFHITAKTGALGEIKIFCILI